jgi:probable rRNA maturation factor
MSDDDGSHPRVLISNRQPLPVDEPSLAALAREVLRAEGAERAELSVSLVEDAEMAELHLRYLGEPGPTDVLAFPIGEDDGEGVRVLGDVVIAPAYAAERNPDLPAELRLLLVHGILHLLGYDHEGEGERREMFARQERYSGVRVA